MRALEVSLAPRRSERLGTDPVKLPRLGVYDGVEDHRDERSEMPHPVGWRADQDDTEGEGRKGLLELQVAVHRDQHVVGAAHEAQEVAVLDARPATADDGLDVVAVKLPSEV